MKKLVIVLAVLAALLYMLWNSETVRRWIGQNVDIQKVNLVQPGG